MVTNGYLLDSDIVITMLRDGSNKTGLRSKILEVGLEKCQVSAITMAELSSGAQKMGSERGFFELSFVRSILSVIPFGEGDSRSAEIFGKIKASLERKGIRLDDMDLMIASTAIDKNLVLVTHNKKHFSRIPDLQIEDWIRNSEARERATKEGL